MNITDLVTLGISLLSFSIFKLLLPKASPKAITENSHMPDIPAGVQGEHLTNAARNRAYRTVFGLIYCDATAFPLQGGVVIKSLTGAELDWLSLSRSQPALRSERSDEEDEFAYQMIRLGARWWRSKKYEFMRTQQGLGLEPWPDAYPPMLHVGYPSSGGVWVFKLRSGDERPEVWSKVIIARDMDERCKALEEFGAIFYEHIDSCPDIPKSLEEAVKVAREWEEKMKQMDERSPFIGGGWVRPG